MNRDFIHFIYPPACFLCEEELTESEYICESCIAELQTLTELELSQFNKNYLHPAFKKALIPYQFDRHSQRLVHLLKYAHGIAIAPFMTRLIFSQFAKQIANLEADVILPCPLHKRKLMEREYNQADLMADALAKETKLAVDKNALRRTRYTKTQTKLNKAQREKNLNRSFEFSSERNYSKIILIDDVITTGTTLNKIAEAILEKLPNAKLYAIAFLSPVRR
jgi:ComF family protein